MKIVHHNIYTQGYYQEKNPTWHVEDSPWKAKQILKMIRKNDLRANRISEIGCGAGEILNQLYLQMPDNVLFSGYEISPQAFELCKQREKDRLRFHLEDLLENGTAFFDIVLCIDVLEHVEDCYGFLRSLRKRGRYKIFHIPIELSAQTVLRSAPILQNRKKAGHVHHFTKDTALATLEDSGYEVLDYYYTASLVDLPDGSFRQATVNCIRKIMYKLNKEITVRLLGGYSLMVLGK